MDIDDENGNMNGGVDAENDTMDSETADEKRVQLRLRYRELLNEAESIEQNEESCSMSVLNTKLSEMSSLYRQVCSAREAAMDSVLLSQYSMIGNRNAQNLNTNLLAFVPSEFTSLLKVSMKSNQAFSENDDDDDLNEMNWVEFGNKASLLFKRCPTNTFFLGTFPKHEQRERKVRAPRDKKLEEAKKAAPEKVSAMGKSEQEMTTAEVERILKILRFNCQRYGPAICFFEFVTDPASFTRTVENIFHLSFLIKDGFVRLSEDDDQLLTLEVASERDTNDKQSASLKKCETVLSITKKQWKEIVRVYKIDKAVIEPRSTTATSSQM